MINNLFITFLLAPMLCSLIYSQDLIVTNDGDSINCKITKVKDDDIYFTFKHKEEIRNTLLPISNVKTYQYNHYQQAEVPEDKIVNYDEFLHLRFSVHGGYSYQTAKVSESVPTDFKDYVKELKSGYHLGGDITYYFTESLGCGMKFTLFKSSNSIESIYIEDQDGNRRYGEMSDNLSISYIGPTFSGRFLNTKNHNAFLINLSLGYMGYSDNKVIIDDYKMTGNTLGSVLEIGYDIGISENLALGILISFTSGTLVEYKWDDGTTIETVELEAGSYESLNRIDFSFGLRFSK